MKIGHISHAFKPITGGQETYLKNLFDVLEARSHDQRVYQLDTGFRDPELRNVPRLPRRFWGTSIERYLNGPILVIRHLGDLVKEDRIIIHYAFYQPWLLWRSNCIVLSHGVEWDNPHTSLGRRFRAWQCRILYRHFTKKLVVNDTNYLRAMGESIAPKEGMFKQVLPGVWFIPNCVDTEYFSRTEPLPAFKEEKLILVPRNLVRPRGVDLGLRAFAIFRTRKPDWKMIIIGDSSDQSYKQELKTLVGELGITASVEFLGSIPWNNMPEYYSSATITWIPTLWSEGTSLSALESRSCGTPVVATNVGGLADLPCILVPPNPEAMAQASLKLLETLIETAETQKTETRRTYNLKNWAECWDKVILA